jgi:hypothetical protein
MRIKVYLRRFPTFGSVGSAFVEAASTVTARSGGLLAEAGVDAAIDAMLN